MGGFEKIEVPARIEDVDGEIEEDETEQRIREVGDAVGNFGIGYRGLAHKNETDDIKSKFEYDNLVLTVAFLY